MAKFFFILAIVAIVYLHLCDCGKKSSDKKDENKGNPSLDVKVSSKGSFKRPSPLQIQGRNWQEIQVSDQPPAPIDLTKLLDMGKMNMGNGKTGKK